MKKRAICQICEETEILRHIMVACRSNEGRVVWQVSNELRRRYDKDLPISEGVVLGCSLAHFKAENGKPGCGKRWSLQDPSI